MIPEEIKQKIDSGDYTFIDKVMSMMIIRRTNYGWSPGRSGNRRVK